jgi:hypothetical protein
VNTRQIPNVGADPDEGVSPPYRPSGPLARNMPRPLPSPPPPAGWREHQRVIAAGPWATMLWWYACDLVRERGGGATISLRDLKRLLDWDEIGRKAKTVIDAGIDAGFFARTQDSIVVYMDALDERRGG